MKAAKRLRQDIRGSLHQKPKWLPRKNKTRWSWEMKQQTISPRAALLHNLRLKIRAIEGAPEHALTDGRVFMNTSQDEADKKPPAAAHDGALPKGSLTEGLLGGSEGGLHEIKPQASGDWGPNHTAATTFMLQLLARRLVVLQTVGTTATDVAVKPVLFCWPEEQRQELGDLYYPGLEGMGLDPSALIIARPKTAQEALWVMEEGLKSGALAAVAGFAKYVDLTSARRLALAAKAAVPQMAAKAAVPKNTAEATVPRMTAETASADSATLCLLLTPPRQSPAGPALSRWRVGPASTGMNNLDEKAPGRSRFHLTQERRRHGAAINAILENNQHIVEWRDETHCFHLVSPLATRAPEIEQLLGPDISRSPSAQSNLLRRPKSFRPGRRNLARPHHYST